MSTTPRSRSEHEIAGYRDVLNTIHESYDYIPPKPSLILQLHRDLYKFSALTVGGAYKIADSVIEETDASGRRVVRFAPTAAWETPEAMEHLCQALADTLKEPAVDPLLVPCSFWISFASIPSTTATAA